MSYNDENTGLRYEIGRLRGTRIPGEKLMAYIKFYTYLVLDTTQIAYKTPRPTVLQFLHHNNLYT
jgi:hypothetical protein